jgi:LacI family transcriptional regulator
LELPEVEFDMNREMADRLVAAGITVVLVDRDICRFPERSPFDLVAVDNRRAGFHVAEHLVSLGCRRLAFVADHPDSSSACERVDGARRALMTVDADLPDERIIRWNPSQGADPISALARDGAVEAFLFVNDLLAREAMSAFAQQGLQVPDDVRVAAFDDLAFSEMMAVPLTTVHQPFEALGINAVEAMISRLLNPDQPPRDIRLAGQLVVRKSCGAELAQKR